MDYMEVEACGSFSERWRSPREEEGFGHGRNERDRDQAGILLIW
jgi:hypothetical protein